MGLLATLGSGKRLCVHAILVLNAVGSSRGHLKNFIVACALVALVVFIPQASTSPLAFVALNRATLNPGQIPPGWQIKVNHGRPDVSVCSDVDGPCLHLKSVKASFGLERDVDVDPAQMPFLNWSWKVTQLPGRRRFPPRGHRRSGRAGAGCFRRPARSELHLGFAPPPKARSTMPVSFPSCTFSTIVCESGAADTQPLDRGKPQRRRRLPARLWQAGAARQGLAHPNQFAAHGNRCRELLRRRSVPQRAVVNDPGYRRNRLHRQPCTRSPRSHG